MLIRTIQRLPVPGAWFIALVATVLLGSAVAQGEFSNASMNGTYAFVGGLGAGPDDPAPAHAFWVVIDYHGDGTWTIRTISFNEPGEPDAEGEPTRDATVNRPDPPPTGTYEVNPDGTYVFLDASGEVLWDGLILRSEMIDGVPVATEYALFHRQPEEETGGLLTGRGVRQNPR